MSPLHKKAKAPRFDTKPLDFDELMAEMFAGSEDAWSRFVGVVHPSVLEICRRRRFVGGSTDPEDTHRDVAVSVLNRLRANGFAALRTFARTKKDHPEASFIRWLSAITANAHVDYLRGQPDYQRRREDSSRRLRRLKREPLQEEIHCLDDSTPSDIEVRRILDCVMSEIFPKRQREALLLWLRGNSGDEVALELGLRDAKAANKLLHAARERLRRNMAAAQRGPTKGRKKS